MRLEGTMLALLVALARVVARVITLEAGELTGVVRGVTVNACDMELIAASVTVRLVPVAMEASLAILRTC